MIELIKKNIGIGLLCIFLVYGIYSDYVLPNKEYVTIPDSIDALNFNFAILLEDVDPTSDINMQNRLKLVNLDNREIYLLTGDYDYNLDVTISQNLNKILYKSAKAKRIGGMNHFDGPKFWYCYDLIKNETKSFPLKTDNNRFDNAGFRDAVYFLRNDQALFWVDTYEDRFIEYDLVNDSLQLLLKHRNLSNIISHCMDSSGQYIYILLNPKQDIYIKYPFELYQYEIKAKTVRFIDSISNKNYKILAATNKKIYFKEYLDGDESKNIPYEYNILTYDTKSRKIKHIARNINLQNQLYSIHKLFTENILLIEKYKNKTNMFWLYFIKEKKTIKLQTLYESGSLQHLYIADYNKLKRELKEN